MQQQNLDLKPINEYRQTMIDGLRHSFPGLKTEELSRAIDWSINNRIHNGPATLDNNYTKKRMDGTVLDVLRYIERMLSMCSKPKKPQRKPKPSATEDSGS